MADYEAPDMNKSEQHSIGENLETHELEALFQHATEGEPAIRAISESENDEKIKAEEAKISYGSQDECDETIDIMSWDDEALDLNQLEEHSMEAETKGLTTTKLQKEEVSETEGVHVLRFWSLT